MVRSEYTKCIYVAKTKAQIRFAVIAYANNRVSHDSAVVNFDDVWNDMALKYEALVKFMKTLSVSHMSKCL